MTEPNQKILKIISFYLGVNYQRQWHQEHQECIDYPSFMSFHYILQKHGIPSVAIKTSIPDLQSLPVPFLIHTEEGEFLVVTEVIDQQVEIAQNTRKKYTLSIQELNSIWDNYALIFDKENIQQEKISWQTQIKRFFFYSKHIIGSIALFVLITGILLYIKRDLYNSLFLFYSLCGICASILYLIRETDKNHYLIKKICPVSKTNKVNCSSILDSKAAYFWNLFSWSDLSLIYFTTLFTTLLFFTAAVATSLIALIALCASGYIFYSLSYQIFIAKKWCVLCIIMVFILILGGIFSIFFLQSGTFQLAFSPHLLFIPLIAVLYTCFYSIIFTLVKVKAYNRVLQQNYKTLKYRPEITQLLFANQLHIETNHLKTIVLKSGNKDCITMVFNPVCGPCMYELDQLLRIAARKEQTQIELIILTEPNKNSNSYLAAKYLLDQFIIAPSNVVQILKHYISQFPNKTEIKKAQPGFNQNESDSLITAHREWCVQYQIQGTPLLFFNANQLPPEYNLSDIDYMCL